MSDEPQDVSEDELDEVAGGIARQPVDEDMHIQPYPYTKRQY